MIMGGCKSKSGDTAEVNDAKTIISSADYGDIGDVLKITPRDVESSDGEAALKAIGLWEEGGHISWRERTGSAGQYNFKDVKITAKDGHDLTVKAMALGGLHMSGETPIVDVVDFSGLVINNKKTSLKIDHLGLTKLPLSQNLSTVSKIDDLLDIKDLDIEVDNGLEGPESVVFKGVTGTADKTVFEIDTLGWGQDPKDQHIRFAAQDVMIKVTETDEAPITLSLKSAKIRGLAPIDAANSTDVGNIKSRNGFLNLLMQNPQIGDMTIEGLDIQSDVFTLDLPSIKQSANQQGGITTINSDMPKLTLGITQTDDLPVEAQQVMAMIKSLGFESMVFSAQSVTEMNKDTDFLAVKAASLDLQDGFDLNYKGEFSGLSSINSLGANASPENIQAVEDKFKIHGFAFSLEDKSIVERGFNLAGEMTGQSPKNLRRQANGILALGSLAALTQKDGSIYSEFTQALSEFLQDGGTMTVQIAPEEPITIKDLEGLQSGKKPDLKRLGFSTATKQ